MGLIAMKPERVAIYARISPSPDGKAGENFSISSQIHEMKQKALKEFGCARPDEFIDNKVSGGDLNRPELDRLRDAIALKKYDVIIAYDPGRWTREPSDKIILKREIEKGGARLVYVTVQYEDTAEGGLSEDVQDAVSKYEKRKFKERSRRCRRDKSRKGHPHSGPAPDGYEYRGHKFGLKGEYVIVEERAKVVRIIYEKTAAGMTNTAVQVWLNEQGILTQEGHRWRRNSVSQVLSKKKTCYYGEMIQNGEIIKVPPIMTQELWDRAHAALERNKIGRRGRPPRHYELSGLLWCSLCGKRCTTYPGTGETYYRCGNVDPVSRRERFCHAPGVPKAALEGVVWNALWDTVCDPGLLWETIGAYYDRVAGRKGKAKDPAVARIDRATRAVAHAERIYFDPEQTIPFEQAKANLNKARQELAEAQTSQGAAVFEMPARKDVNAASTALRQMRQELEDFQDRRDALCLLIEKIRYADREVEIHCRLPRANELKCHRRISDDGILIGSIPFVIKARVA
jgi:site-specific DNA recombinase